MRGPQIEYFPAINERYKTRAICTLAIANDAREGCCQRNRTAPLEGDMRERAYGAAFLPSSREPVSSLSASRVESQFKRWVVVGLEARIFVSDEAESRVTQVLSAGERCADRVLGPPVIKFGATRPGPVHEGSKGRVAGPEVVRRAEQRQMPITRGLECRS